MYFIYILYYLLFITLLFALVPSEALFYIRPLLVSLFTLIYSIPYLITKKLDLKSKRLIFKISLTVISFAFFIALKEFAKVSLKTSLILGTFISLSILLILSGKLIKKIVGYTLVSFFTFLALWPGTPIKYRSNISNGTDSAQYSINSFSYGLNQEIKSYSVDPTLYYPGSKGLSKWYDKQYWKIDKKLPLAGTVFHPVDKGKYPLIILAHGNHLAEKKSHHGYDYLLKNLAGKGYIAVTVDQNFLNGNWTNLGVGYPNENDARGFLILEHIKLMEKWNSDINSPLYNQIDMENIGLIGHSRGGEAVAIAGAYRNAYNIKAIAALAPTDGQYPETIILKNVSYMSVHGANDGDIRAFKGRNQYNRTSFDNDHYNIKASYYIEGVNHVQFNSDWGKTDSTSLGQMFYNRKSNIDNYDQQEVAKVLINNYFDIVLKDKTELIPLLVNQNLNPSIPDVTYINDFKDSNTVTLYDFSTIDRQNINFYNTRSSLGYRYSDYILNLKWDKKGSVTFKNTKQGLPASNIIFSLSNHLLKKVDLEVVIKSDNKVLKKQFIEIKPMLDKKVFKFNAVSRLSNEPHFQYYTIPFDDNWDSIELKFLTDKGSISIDNIGLSTSYQKKEL